MLKNYPATYLFLLSLLFLMFLILFTPFIGIWHIYCAIALKIITFTTTIICAFFLFGTIIDIANGMFFRKIHH
jgi:hypothetical protein